VLRAAVTLADDAGIGAVNVRNVAHEFGLDVILGRVGTTSPAGPDPVGLVAAPALLDSAVRRHLGEHTRCAGVAKR